MNGEVDKRASEWHGITTIEFQEIKVFKMVHYV